MISCTEFIPAYSELFKFLDKKGGKKAVNDFWNYLSDNFLGNLEELVKKHGIMGCWMYWSHTLNEEAADFTMTCDEDAGEFTIDMHYCPSKGRLLNFKHIEPYEDYCGHCQVLYNRVLEPLGFEQIYDTSHVNEARCKLTFKRKANK